MRPLATSSRYQLDPLQRIATSLMAFLVLLTFVGTNMQALLWQSSDWLVSTVLPAVVVDLTNDERADLATAPLQRNDLLDVAAQEKAQHMAANEYFAHFAPDGTTPWSFFDASGYVYAHAGENLAIHFTDSTEVVEAWMQSPGHRKNIVDAKYTEIGVGTAKGTFDGYDTVYVVQLFGTPAVPTAAPVEPVAPIAPQTSPESVVATAEESASAESTAADLAALQTQIEAVAGAVDQLADEEQAAEEESRSQTPPVAAEPPVVPVAANDVPSSNQTPVEPATTVAISKADTVVVSSELATSSGLTVATVTESPSTHAGATLAAVATQPNVLLNIVYTGVVGVIIVLLVVSLLGEARRLHVVQVAYSIALLFAIGGLWYVHTLLTSGAVIA